MLGLESALRAGLREIPLDLSDAQVGLLLDYVAMISRWNKVYNLTALREPAQMLSHHLLDSLAVIPALRRQLALGAQSAQGGAGALRLLDVGSGAGLPGVVVAIACPQVEVCCVDAVAKKAAFVRQVAASLRLPNLRAVHGRVEDLSQGQGVYEVVCSRAFASLQDFCRWTWDVLASDGVWLAMKGLAPLQELEQLPSGVESFHVEPLLVPGLDAERCIVWLRKTTGTR